MDFDDHDHDHDVDVDEEMQPMPVCSSYETPPQHGGLGAVMAPKPPGELVGNRVNKGPSCGGGRYRECLKNHAVGIGGHAVDGCGEFMAAGEDGTIDALRCAACNCHRNFHRKEPESSSSALVPGAGNGWPFSPAAVVPYGATPHNQFSPYYRTPAGYLHHQHHHHHMAAAAAAAAAAGVHPHRPLAALPSTSHSGSDDVPGMAVGPLGGAGPSGSGSGKKRFRTKFSQEQKDKMLPFAERVGWRIQKHDEAAVQQFCDEVGVKRHVLKVWMHNNKHTLGKKP